MIIMAENRKLQMDEVLKHPLGPLPWSLATSDGMPWKMNKAVLGKEVTKAVPLAESIQTPAVSLIDGMSIVQRISGDKKAVSDIATAVLSLGVAEAGLSSRVDFVFDVYKENSIKDFERKARGESQGTNIQYTCLAGGYKIMQWRDFLKSNENKNNLVKFMAKEWMLDRNRNLLRGKVLYVTCMEKCFKITTNDVEEIHELNCCHEEVDTRLLLHAAHASRQHYESLVVHSDDTDVRVLLIGMATQLHVNVFQQVRSSTRSTYIDITKVVQVLGSSVSQALICYHAFTGCDTVRAFAGKGKATLM